MRISDWSSDVCSSDLLGPELAQAVQEFLRAADAGEGIDAPSGEAAVARLEARPQHRQAARQALAGEGAVGDHHRGVGAREAPLRRLAQGRSEEHTSELQSLMRISYAVFCLQKKNNIR